MAMSDSPAGPPERPAGEPGREPGRELGNEPAREPAREPSCDAETLPCGRGLAALWEAWDEGVLAADPHVAAGCPHCAGAVEDLRRLDGFVRSTRAVDAAAAEADRAAGGGAADAVAARVMDLVRRELRPGPPLPLGRPEEDAWIVEAAAARTFRAAAEALPGVRAGSCRVRPAGADRRGPRWPGGTPPRGPVRVRLEVAADLRWSVPELADAVRARVAEAARDELGMPVAAIDVHVVDVLTDDTGGRSGW